MFVEDSIFILTKREQASFIVISCELITTKDFKSWNPDLQNYYKLEDFNTPCVYIGRSTISNHHLLKIYNSHSLARISNLENDFFGRIIVDATGKTVATIYRYINTIELLE